MLYFYRLFAIIRKGVLILMDITNQITLFFVPRDQKLSKRSKCNHPGVPMGLILQPQGKC